MTDIERSAGSRRLIAVLSPLLAFEALSFITVYAEIGKSVELQRALLALAVSVPCLAGALMLCFARETSRTSSTMASLATAGVILEIAWLALVFQAISPGAGLVFFIACLAAGGISLWGASGSRPKTVNLPKRQSPRP
ncbi:MAG: hypothetical protein ACREVL_16050 [Solimonas sp.]